MSKRTTSDDNYEEPYIGPVVFAQGVHYAVDHRGDADYSLPLRRDSANSGWRVARDGEPLHNDIHFGAVITPDTSSGGASVEAK